MNNFMSMLSKTATKVKVKTIKHGPAIAITTGLLGMAGALYLTYRASTKIEQEKKERKENLLNVEIYRENGCIPREDGVATPYTEEDAKNDRHIYNCRFWVNIAKHTALPVFAYVVSGFLIYKGFRVEAKRLATMGAAVAGLTAQLTDVTKELEDAVGKEKANDILLGKHTHTETEISEDGEVTTKEVTTTDRLINGYTFEFSKETSPALWSGDYKRDKDFIEGNMNHANYLLHEKHGHVFFNEILDDFEVKRVDYGCTNGSVDTDGHYIVFDVDERRNPDGTTYFIISVNLQGYIADKI